MTKTVLPFPVKCPVCHKERIAVLQLRLVTRAMADSRPIRLYASCHNKSWDASKSEIERLQWILGF